MLLKTRRIIHFAFLLIPYLVCCNACQEETGFPKENILLGAEDSEASISIDFQASASGSIGLSMECQKYTRGIISLWGSSELDSSVLVFEYPFRILQQFYPAKLSKEEPQQLKLEWNLFNSSLKVFLDSNLQTTCLAENDKTVSINKISIRNTSVRPDSSKLKLKFTGSVLNEDILTTERLRIVAFGSSTTAFRNTITGTYSQRLPEKLSSRGIDNIVFNEGVGGSHTGRLIDNDRHKRQHALDRFDASVLSRDPDFVIISLGLNDSWVDEGKDKSRIPKTSYRENLEFMIAAIREQGGMIILMTPNAIASQYEDWRYQRSSEYAAIMRNIALENNLPLINQWLLFEEYASVEGQEIEDLLLDGMHPNDLWHEELSNLLTNTIIEQLNK